jgi:VIT1/CCC1 family predicted Fe2+/Mn2+ transporter
LARILIDELPARRSRHEEGIMVTVLLVILVLMLLGAVPAWPYNRSWGYMPSGTLGLVLIIVLLLVLTGRI